uniref:Cyclin-like domain-containing protein n=1 Tax=Timema monikensis TaxID=170555 RepID=A0A7R9HK61_9NEOP|nr:unnamed protein product [Timema monikensis]
MDLLCVERLTDSQFAINDKVIFKDMRVLRNLLDLETKYIPPCNYFGTVQKDIQPFMRKVVATWMSEVCEEQRCEDQVFPLAVNFLDRFLCRCSISRRQLQLTAAVSLLLASKIRQCHALSVDLLCFYTDHSITPDEMRSWELLFLSRLKWNIAAVTGFDYVDHVLQRVSWGENNPVVRRHAHTLVSVCYTGEIHIMHFVSIHIYNSHLYETKTRVVNVETRNMWINIIYMKTVIRGDKRTNMRD